MCVSFGAYDSFFCIQQGLTSLLPCSIYGSVTQGMKKPYTAPPPFTAPHCSVAAVVHLTSSGATKHKRPLFQLLEHCPVSWSPEKGQRWWQCNLEVTLCCVLMVPGCSAFLQRSKVLFPAHGPVFSSPVSAPHN